MIGLFSGRRKLKVDWGELADEKENLSSFLCKTLNEKITSDDHHLLVDSEKLSVQNLQSAVNKFIYHRHLNNRYWVALEGGAVRIHRFKEKKNEKRKKPTTTPSTIKHGWL
jgi:hypothetical protein